MSEKKPLTKAVIAAFLALAVSMTVALSNFSYPFAVYRGIYSDHFSHMCSTVLFAAKGLDIYRKPVRENLKHSTQPKDIQFAHSNGLGTQELFVNPLDARRPPLAINWSEEIRAYPPGVYLIFMPFAAAFQTQTLSFATVNRLIIIFLVLMACVNAFVLFSYGFSAKDCWGLGLRLFSASLACIWIEVWALRGFYDIISLLFLFVCLWKLEQRRWLDCVFSYCAAVFIHYRALYYAPVPFVALWRAWRESRLRGGNLVFDWAKEPRAWIALAMALVAGGCFWIALPHLESFTKFNPLFHFYEAWSGLGWELSSALGFAVLTLALMALARDWTALLVLGCFLTFLARTPQACQWHSLFLAPLVVFCSRNSGSWPGRLQWVSMLALTCWLGHFVYQI